MSILDNAKNSHYALAILQSKPDLYSDLNMRGDFYRQFLPAIGRKYSKKNIVNYQFRDFGIGSFEANPISSILDGNNHFTFLYENAIMSAF